MVWPGVVALEANEDAVSLDDLPVDAWMWGRGCTVFMFEEWMLLKLFLLFCVFLLRKLAVRRSEFRFDDRVCYRYVSMLHTGNQRQFCNQMLHHSIQVFFFFLQTRFMHFGVPDS